MSSGAPYRLPREPGRWRAIVLAGIVHAALFAFLWFGIRWQNETPVAVEAEVWSPQAREAAPRPVAPEPERQPEPVPEPKPAPVRIAPPVEAPQEKAPDIALEREKKRQEQQRAKQEQEQAEKRREAQARLKEEEAQKLKTQKARLAQEQADQAAQKREQARAAQQAEALAKKKTDDQKKLAAEKQRAAEAQNDKRLAAMREETLRRLTDSAAAGSTAGSGGSGDAARSQGSHADASYTQKVGAKIKSNTIFNGAEESSSNPSAEFAVELLPDGSIRRLRKTKSSGIPGFDEAVSRAIEKSQPFPPDKSGSVPSGFTVSHRPKDQ